MGTKKDENNPESESLCGEFVRVWEKERIETQSKI
jgi:hypothetical protein